MGKRGIFSLFVLTIAAVIWPATLGLAQPDIKPIVPVRDLHVSDIFIASELGYVVERHQPRVEEPDPLIIVHIQEAHVNYEVQQHMVEILSRLIERYGLTLILVEGGEGDVGLTYMREYGSQKNRQKVADKFLRAGIITAEEYLDIVSEYPITLWGVERDELYDRNLQAFLEAEEQRDAFTAVVGAVREAVDRMAPKLAGPVLNKLEAEMQAFENEELGLEAYAKTLVSLAERERVAEEAYPQLRMFLAVRKLEPTIDLSLVPQEQQNLMAKLNRLLDEQTLSGLTGQALELRAGKVTRAEFYTELDRLARKAGLDVDSYTHLARYIHYVKESAQIKAKVLGEELDRLEVLLRERLALSPEGRRLNALREQLDLLEKLMALKLSPEEYQRLRALDLGRALTEWRQFLTEQARHHGMPQSAFQALDRLRVKLPVMHNFYEVAAERDQALVDNAMRKLHDSEQRLAVLITGGFHSAKITQMLKDRGVGVVVLAPKASQPTNERLYRAVVKYKSGFGSYEDVMAIVNQTSALGNGELGNGE